MSPPVPPDYKDIAKDFLLALNNGKFFGSPEMLARAAMYAVRQLQKKDIRLHDDDQWLFEYHDEPPG